MTEPERAATPTPSEYRPYKVTVAYFIENKKAIQRRPAAEQVHCCIDLFILLKLSAVFRRRLPINAFESTVEGTNLGKAAGKGNIDHAPPFRRDQLGCPATSVGDQIVIKGGSGCRLKQMREMRNRQPANRGDDIQRNRLGIMSLHIIVDRFQHRHGNGVLFCSDSVQRWQRPERSSSCKNAEQRRLTAYPYPMYCVSSSRRNKGISYVEPRDVKICIEEDRGTIRNGHIRCEALREGVLTFYRDDTVILREYYRSERAHPSYGVCLELVARRFVPTEGDEYAVSAVFEANAREKIYGMGQYQMPELDRRGCILELAQRNSQISVPFYLSNLGYGFLWNHPGVGKVMFGKNCTEWHTDAADELDYWIVADETPKKILKSFTEVSGRAPDFLENALGLWQCKLRYLNQEEVLEVAREYHRRGLPLDVIVIDYFHWTERGDWKFDPQNFPDPKAMIDELRSMGTRCMVSVWPTVSQKSENHPEMKEKSLLVRGQRGNDYGFQWMGACDFYDSTNPEARAYLWQKIKENYGQYGIDLFWLDIRLELRNYVAALYREASENGSPLIRTIFYEFPEDPLCWELEDQYMFGSKYLVAPVLYAGMTERTVYLPNGQWKDYHNSTVYRGGQMITVKTPIELMPVFARV